MKRRADFGHYVSVLAEVMETTENMGAKLNPFFETFRKALDEGKDISPEDYDKTKAEFENGVELYENNLKKIAGTGSSDCDYRGAQETCRGVSSFL